MDETDSMPQAIQYRGNCAQLDVTAQARRMLEDHGYSFPIRDGVMFWCLGGKDEVALDVEEGDEHESISINMKDVDVDGQKAVLVCQAFTRKNGGDEVKRHLLFTPGSKSSTPFTGLSLDNPLVAKCCS